MKKTGSGILPIVIGLLFIASALLLYQRNRAEDRESGVSSAEVLQMMERLTEETAQASSSDGETEEADDSEQSAEMPVVMLDGYEYVGYLSIPDLELTLPVMAQWDYERLKIAPCRQFGSTRTDNLVIAAHNYESHFGLLKDLSVGSEVKFCDMEGNVILYTVSKIDTIDPTAVESIQNPDSDLILYTCTKGGARRVAVFCDRVKDA